MARQAIVLGLFLTTVLLPCTDATSTSCSDYSRPRALGRSATTLRQQA